MKQIPLLVQLRHLIITSRWQRWLFPVICILPYLAILIWMLTRGLIWVAQVLLAPLLMGVVLGLLTIWLANAEFKSRLRKR